MTLNPMQEPNGKPCAGRSDQSSELQPLLDPLPQKLIRRILPVNHSAFPVLAGDKEQAIVALKLEPSDIIDAARIWPDCVFQVVGDGLRLQVQRVLAVIRDVIVEGGDLLFSSTGGPVHEGLASTFNVDLDGHPAGAVVYDEAGRVVESKVKVGIGALDRNQSPGSDQLLGSIVLWWRLCSARGEQGNEEKEQGKDAAGVHGRQVYRNQTSSLAALPGFALGFASKRRIPLTDGESV